MSRSLARIIERAELVEEAREVGISETLVRKLYDQGWKDAMAVSERTRLRESERRKTALATAQGRFQQQIEEAMAAGHRRGFQEGIEAARVHAPPPPRDHGRTRASAPPPPPPRAGESTGKLLEQVEAECRIIAESNPSMAPAINALRHRLKKLR